MKIRAGTSERDDLRKPRESMLKAQGRKENKQQAVKFGSDSRKGHKRGSGRQFNGERAKI